MNIIKSFASLAIIGLAASCSTPMANESNACMNFLFERDIVAGTDSEEFNIERDYSLSSETLGSTYVSLRGLNSGCVPYNIDAVSASEIGVVVDASKYKDIKVGSQGGRPWIQFIYPSLGEYGPGLASTITFYGANGDPETSSLVAFYYSWDGAQTMSSTMASGRVLRCVRNIEFFSYKESGDIHEALIEPIRSECDNSYEVLH